jgi:hypothetical protein
MEEKIAGSGLSFDEQMPLLMATISAISELEYWSQVIETGGPWAIYTSDNKAINYMRLGELVSASVHGALLTYGLIKHPHFEPFDFYSVLTGSVGLVAGNVVLGWNQV